MIDVMLHQLVSAPVSRAVAAPPGAMPDGRDGRVVSFAMPAGSGRGKADR
jgi:hypothetical protein